MRKWSERKEMRMEIEMANLLPAFAPTNVVGKTGGCASDQSISPRPLSCDMCHLMEALSPDGERPQIHGNTDCNHGNSHRYNGYLGRNGNHV